MACLWHRSSRVGEVAGSGANVVFFNAPATQQKKQLTRRLVLKQINVAHVRKWMGLNRKNIRAPQAISTICPHCGERVVFTTRAHIHDEKRESVACTGACPSCSEYVHFWSMDPKGSESTDEEDPETIYMSPAGDREKEPLNFSIDLPESLERAYLSSVEAHGSANYSATALCCKQAMEKIFFHLLPEEKSSVELSEAITEVHDNHNLARPLENLSASTSSGGKLERHFEMEREFDADTSRAMVELLEHLICLLYTSPSPRDLSTSRMPSSA